LVVSSASQIAHDPDNELWGAAMAATEASAPGSALAAVWEDLVCGRLRPWCETTTPDRIHLIARINRNQPGLSCGEAAFLLRVLCGEPQKVIASELGIATSTACGRYLRALDRLDLTNRIVPLAVVLAAQSWAGIGRVASARTATFEQRGQIAAVVSVSRPMGARMTALTRAQQEVAQSLIEGECPREIARRRQTSVHTVARQSSSACTRLGVGGRYALIRCALALRCFS
jgi:DNA-binding NarL/FixJ family response regulator